MNNNINSEGAFQGVAAVDSMKFFISIYMRL